MSDSPSFDLLANPNYLAAIARGLDDVNVPKKRNESKEIDLSRTDRRKAKVLDSLAYVLVSRIDKQVVAVGAILEGSVMRLVVAENDEIQEGTKDHLADITDRLVKIRQARPPHKDRSPPVNSFYFETAETPHATDYERQLVDLEGVILHHAHEKLAQRFRKRKQHLNFARVATDVLGSSASECVDKRTEDEREMLGPLQDSHRTLAEFRGEYGIEAMLYAVETLDKAFRPGVEARLDLFAGGIRDLLHVLRGGKRLLIRHTEFCNRWNMYTAERLKRKWADNGGFMEAGDSPRKAPDVLRWLDKSTALCEHFLEIASVATSDTLAGYLLSQSTETKTIFLRNKPPRPSMISVDRQSVSQVLRAAGVVVENENGASIDRFLRRLAQSHDVKDFNNADKLIIDTSGPIHCECKVLAALHGKQAVPYIGVSKLSCAFCDVYFAAYRRVTNSLACTMGGHDQTQPWNLPTLPDSSLNALLREEVNKRLMQQIRRGWNRYHAQLRRESQSTTASDKVEEPPKGIPLGAAKNNAGLNDWVSQSN